MIQKKLYSTVSGYSDDIMKVVLAVDFFTRAILYLILNMSLIEFSNEWLDSITIGKETDFSVQWYQKVGYIFVFLMFICIWTPLVETLVEWFVKWF